MGDDAEELPSDFPKKSKASVVYKDKVDDHFVKS